MDIQELPVIRLRRSEDLVEGCFGANFDGKVGHVDAAEVGFEPLKDRGLVDSLVGGDSERDEMDVGEMTAEGDGMRSEQEGLTPGLKQKIVNPFSA